MQNRPPALRDLGALVAALFASGGVNFFLGHVGLVIARRSINPISTAAVFAVSMFFLVPASAGAMLGALADHPVRLAIPLVLLSLGVTYFSLGPAGMPHGWKILAYVFQTLVIAAVAHLVSAYRRRTVTYSTDV